MTDYCSAVFASLPGFASVADIFSLIWISNFRTIEAAPLLGTKRSSEAGAAVGLRHVWACGVDMVAGECERITALIDIEEMWYETNDKKMLPMLSWMV